MARVAHYRDALSAYTAACALDHSTGEQWMVVTIGMGWKYVYSSCARASLQSIAALAQVYPVGFDAFSRHRVKRSDYWNAAKVRAWADGEHYRCYICGLGPAHHPDHTFKTVLT